MNAEPVLLARARLELGVHETPGPKSTLRIDGYRRQAGLSGIRGDDGAVPWCAIFINAMVRQLGLKGTASAMARSFSKWGQACPIGTPGAVTVISSSRGPASGHVFIATGRVSSTHIEGRGGNQDDSVSDDWWPRKRIVASRWPAEWPLPAAKPTIAASAAPVKAAHDA